MNYSVEITPETLYENCIALTYGDIEKLMLLNEKCEWGFSSSDCLRFIADHEEAVVDIENGYDLVCAYKAMESVEWRLEDANFHTLCSLLKERKYREAVKWVIDEYYDEQN